MADLMADKSSLTAGAPGREEGDPERGAGLAEQRRVHTQLPGVGRRHDDLRPEQPEHDRAERLVFVCVLDPDEPARHDAIGIDQALAQRAVGRGNESQAVADRPRRAASAACDGDHESDPPERHTVDPTRPWRWRRSPPAPPWAAPRPVWWYVPACASGSASRTRRSSPRNRPGR